MPEERFSTASPLPPRLHRLHELALDLWWSWDDRARFVFRQLDYSLWRATAHNPCRCCSGFLPSGSDDAAADPNFLKAYDEAIFGLDQARTVAHPWWRDQQSMLGNGSIAYFSAEFALHQSLPIYAGGLGVLAGDHCKEARGPRPAVRRHRLHVSAGLLPQRMSN
jgi:starch phosphorylase